MITAGIHPQDWFLCICVLPGLRETSEWEFYLMLLQRQGEVLKETVADGTHRVVQGHAGS